MAEELFWWVPACGTVGLIFAIILWIRINKAEAGTEKMATIAAAIREGAMTFIKREYVYLAVFVIVLFVILGYQVDIQTAISFLVGALFSALAGYVGMRVATVANVRTAAAARKGVNPALTLAFSSGTVMGLSLIHI